MKESETIPDLVSAFYFHLLFYHCLLLLRSNASVTSTLARGPPSVLCVKRVTAATNFTKALRLLDPYNSLARSVYTIATVKMTTVIAAAILEFCWHPETLVFSAEACSPSSYETLPNQVCSIISRFE